MTKQEKHNPSNPCPPEVLEQFSDEAEQKEIMELWEKSGTGLRQLTDATGIEVDEALNNVHTRLGFYQSPAEEKIGNISAWIQKNGRWLTAAVALLILSFGFLFMPKVISVPYGEVAELSFPDGSVLELNSGTTVRYSRLFGYTHRALQLDGEAFFSVRAGEEPFRILANGSVTEVMGTEFNVRSWSDEPGKETEVSVTEGEVHFYPGKDYKNRVVLSSGEMSRWNSQMEKPSVPDPVPASETAAWRDNVLVFHERPLFLIFRDLERKYNVNIDLETDEVAYDTLTGYYAEVKGIESVLEDICMVKGLLYSETANGYRVYQ